MELTNDDKEQLRALIQKEILNAFNVALDAAINSPLQQSTDALNPEKRQEMENQKAVIAHFGKAIINSLKRLEAETRATIIEKTDSEQAKRIRGLAVTDF